MQQFVLYSDRENKKLYLECWGASTKHPDIMFRYEYYTPSEFQGDLDNIFAWLLECASKMTFAMHVDDLVDFALEVRDAIRKYYRMEKVSAS